MLHFFKRIRQQLISEGKAGRYLAYAFGEIILITIGLFIAIQLNNVRDKHKAQEFELKMLREVQRTIDQDIWRMEMFTRRLESVDSAINKLLSLSGRPGEFPDTLEPVLDRVRSGITYQYNPGGYEAIKSRGLDLISDDSIRLALVDLYDRGLPRVERFLSEYDMKYEQKSIDMFLELFVGEVTRMPDGSIRTGFRARNADIFRNGDFITFLMLRSNITEHGLLRLPNAIRWLKSTRSLLERKIGPLPE